MVGRFAVAVDGREVDDRQVGSAKARRLLALLVVHRGHSVSTDRIIDALWETEPPPRAAENVATLVSRLRRALGASVIAGARGSYRLGDGAGIRVDVDDADEKATRAQDTLRTAPAISLAAAGRALELVGAGDLLEGEPDAEWLYQARLQLAGLLRRTRLIYAEAALGVGEFAAAREVAERALAADALDESACRALMRALHREGEPAAALAVYQRLRTVLDAELGSVPAPETRAVHLAILQERESMSADPPRFVRSVPHGDDISLVGRDVELGGLEHGWREAAAAHPGLIILTGEAGIGKTRLIDELATVAASSGGVVPPAVSSSAIASGCTARSPKGLRPRMNWRSAPRPTPVT